VRLLARRKYPAGTERQAVMVRRRSRRWSGPFVLACLGVLVIVVPLVACGLGWVTR
jgi:hypothetical protein